MLEGSLKKPPKAASASSSESAISIGRCPMLTGDLETPTASAVSRAVAATAVTGQVQARGLQLATPQEVTNFSRSRSPRKTQSATGGMGVALRMEGHARPPRSGISGSPALR